MKTLRCTGCGKHKSVRQFYRSRTIKRGYAWRCSPCAERYRARWNAQHREQNIAAGRRDRRRLRAALLQHYGGCRPKCACCGERHAEFLTLDHVNGGGNAERRLRGGTTPLWRWLRQKGFPSGYQVLCHNCNAAKHIYGSCPHIRLRAVK